MTIPITWTERSRIPNLSQLTERVRSNGGSIVEYQRVWSLLLYCESRPMYRWVGPGCNRSVAGFGHALFCLLLGWWSPPGIIWTLPAVVNNLCGGVDVTQVLTQPPPLPGQPWDPVAARDYVASRGRQGMLTIVSVVLVVSSLFYLGWCEVTRPKAPRKIAQVVPDKPGDGLADLLMDEESKAFDLRVAKYGEEREVDGTDLYIKIAEPLRPVERWRKYEDALVAALHNGNRGEVMGGGAMTQKDGTIAYCGLDVVVADPPEKGIEAIRAVLRAAGAPNGSQIEFLDSDTIILINDE